MVHEGQRASAKAFPEKGSTAGLGGRPLPTQGRCPLGGHHSSDGTAHAHHRPLVWVPPHLLAEPASQARAHRPGAWVLCPPPGGSPPSHEPPQGPLCTEPPPQPHSRRSRSRQPHVTGFLSAPPSSPPLVCAPLGGRVGAGGGTAWIHSIATRTLLGPLGSTLEPVGQTARPVCCRPAARVARPRCTGAPAGRGCGVGTGELRCQVQGDVQVPRWKSDQ